MRVVLLLLAVGVAITGATLSRNSAIGPIVVLITVSAFVLIATRLWMPIPAIVFGAIGIVSLAYTSQRSWDAGRELLFGIAFICIMTSMASIQFDRRSGCKLRLPIDPGHSKRDAQ